MPAAKILTLNINGTTVVIDKHYGLNAVALLLVSGTATVDGTSGAGGQVSSALTINSTNPSLTISAGANNVIDGLTINASGGQVYLIGHP